MRRKTRERTAFLSLVAHGNFCLEFLHSFVLCHIIQQSDLFRVGQFEPRLRPRLGAEVPLRGRFFLYAPIMRTSPLAADHDFLRIEGNWDAL